MSPPAGHVLPDVLRSGLDIVFCGTAAGAASARLGAYYAGPGNAFWTTLHRVGLTPRRLEPAEFRLVTDFGLGLTDLAKGASGSDSVIDAANFDPRRLRRLIGRYRPGILAFTSKRAAFGYLGQRAAYGLHADTVGSTRLFVLPSPSGAARGYWDETHWHALARLRSRLAERPPCP